MAARRAFDLQRLRMGAQPRLQSLLRRPLYGLVVLSAVTALAWAANGDDDDRAELAKMDALIKESDRQHWSFQPLEKPQRPAVRDATWTRNPIDSFVLAALEVRGWKPSPPAEPRALLRRMYLDLIGMPPTIA